MSIKTHSSSLAGGAARAQHTGARNDGGFALVIVLLALIGLTALATGGHLLSSTDYKITQNHQASVRAFYTADAGLRHYLGTQRGTPGDTVSLELPDGTAEVVATELNRPDSLKILYLITSQGSYAPPEGGVATRTVGTLAIMDLFTFWPTAALTSGVGIRKNGGAGTLSGYDEAPPGECELLIDRTTIPGVAVPPGGYVQNGGSPIPEGDPPIFEGDPLAFLRDTQIDWPGIMAGTALTFDYVIPEDQWPSFDELSEDDWPVIYVDTNSYSVNPPKSGRGTLIVRHDLTMNGSFSWDGIIMVGDALTSNGNQRVKGAVITGLNLLLGEDPPETDLGNGNKTFRYNSCNVQAAMSSMSTLAPEPGTWFEAF